MGLDKNKRPSNLECFSAAASVKANIDEEAKRTSGEQRDKLEDASQQLKKMADCFATGDLPLDWLNNKGGYNNQP